MVANNCFYDMKVVGKKENVDELIRILLYKNENLYMYRIFSADVYEEWYSDGKYYVVLCGDVAWSVISTMLKDITSNKSNLTNLQSETKRLTLSVEIFSSEPGMCFQEHFILSNGEIKVDECVDYTECYFDEMDWSGNSIEEKFALFCEYNGISDITLDDLEDGNLFKDGGFDNYGVWTI